MKGQMKISRDEQTQALRAIAKMLPSSQGRRKLAAMFTRMVNMTPDVKSVGREALAYAPVENSQQALLTYDVAVESYVVTDIANYQVDVYKSKKVMVPQIHLTSNLDMTVLDIKDCTYDLPTRVKERVKQQITAKEDQAIFGIFAKASVNNPYNPSISVPKANFNIDTVIDAAANIEGTDLEPKSIFINSGNLGVFKKAGFDYLDDATKREYLQTGVVAVINGLTVYKSRFVPKDTCYVTAARESTGVCFEVLPLTITTADDPRSQTLGFVASQHAGYAVTNQRAVQEIKLT